MYTRPEYRRRGIASKTLDLLVKDIRARGITAISLDFMQILFSMLLFYAWTSGLRQCRRTK